MRRVIPLHRHKRLVGNRNIHLFQQVERFPSKRLDLRPGRSTWALEGCECDVLDGLFGGRAYARRVLRASRLRLFRLWKTLEAGPDDPPKVLLYGWPPFGEAQPAPGMPPALG